MLRFKWYDESSIIKINEVKNSYLIASFEDL